MTRSPTRGTTEAIPRVRSGAWVSARWMVPVEISTVGPGRSTWVTRMVE